MINQVGKAIEILRSGGVIAYPTDTTYGIGCDATNEVAVEKIFEIKGRDFKKPLGLAFASVAMIEEYCEISENEKEILEKILPGPFMVLLKKKSNISDRVTAGSDMVGVRIPDHEIVSKIVGGLSKPIITTSANISGEADPVSAVQVELNVDMVVRGECQHKRASSVIDIKNKEILRSGPGDKKAKEIFDTI